MLREVEGSCEEYEYSEIQKEHEPIEGMGKEDPVPGVAEAGLISCVLRLSTIAVHQGAVV